MLEISASDLIEQNAIKYGKYMVVSKFPNPVDGLKRVHIRILWKCRTETGPFMTQIIIGSVNQIHPHGDGSIFGALVRMTQPFCYAPTFLEGDGEIGNYGGDNAAAPRYTEMRVSEFTKDVFYNNIDHNAIEKRQVENLSGYEPVNFVPAIPTALIYANLTVGYGFNSQTVALNLRNVCDIASAYIKHMKVTPFKAFDMSSYSEKLLPDFPVINNLLNADKLIEKYEDGDFKEPVRLEGTVELTANSICIFTIGYGAPFSSIRSVIETAVGKRDSWYDRNILSIDELSDELMRGNLLITLRRNSNVFEVWDNIKRMIDFTTTVHPKPNYITPDGFVYELSYLNILQMWYDKRYNILLATKKHKLADLTVQIRNTEALLIICGSQDQVDYVINKIIRVYEEDEGIKILCEKYKITHSQAMFLYGAALRILTRTSKADLEVRYAALKERIEQLRQSFINIPDEMIEEIRSIKKKHGLDRTTKIPDYIGYVKIGIGCIQFETSEEVFSILKGFPKDNFTIVQYPKNGHTLAFDSNNRPVEKTAKIINGIIYNLGNIPSSIYTIFINAEGVGSVIKGFILDKENQDLLYTTKKSKIISRDGQVTIGDITQELSVRKTLSTGSKTKVIYAFPEISTEICYIAVFCTSTPNVIVFYRVTGATKHIAINPTGKVKILHTYGKEWFVNIDEIFLQRQTINGLFIKNTEAFFDGKSQIRIDLNQRTKSNKYMTPY